jgi:hypothetical protein
MTTIYQGDVFPLRGPAAHPTFRYERTVEARNGDLVSTHVTRDASGAIALDESAAHSETYALAEYTLRRNQLGQHGTVRIADGRVVFHLVDGPRHLHAVEPDRGATVVGPTLVGHVVQSLPALRAGGTGRVRLAVLDRLETIGFDLRAVDAPPGTTRIRMTPSSFLLRLVIAPIHFTFDAATDKLVRLEGRVPPKLRIGHRWRDFDARVEYRFLAEAYR